MVEASATPEFAWSIYGVGRGGGVGGRGDMLQDTRLSGALSRGAYASSWLGQQETRATGRAGSSLSCPQRAFGLATPPALAPPWRPQGGAPRCHGWGLGKAGGLGRLGLGRRGAWEGGEWAVVLHRDLKTSNILLGHRPDKCSAHVRSGRRSHSRPEVPCNSPMRVHVRGSGGHNLLVEALPPNLAPQLGCRVRRTCRRSGSCCFMSAHRRHATC
jgi:hypothetical protein